MNPNELRIGNLFTTHIPMVGSWIEQQRFDNQIMQCKVCTFKDEETFKYFTGIPITKEWILKLGWQLKYKSEQSYEKEDSKIEIFCTETNPNAFFIDIYDSMNNVHLGEIKYIHQLQNLYFTIVGSVLAVAPPCP